MNLTPVSDRGAVAALFAILLSSLVLFGLAAFTVDLGQLYAERRVVQNGADAAVLAIAQSCAKAEASCDSSPAAQTLGKEYADANASDGTTSLTEVCIHKAGTTIGSCTPSSGAWVDCLSDTPSGDYVQVRTRTRMADGTTFYPRHFSRALAGLSSDPGTPVVACSRALWGGVQAAASGLALTISLCEWQEMTSNGTSFAPPPPYPPIPSASFERVMRFHTTSTTTCGGGESGWDMPGGFGWLDDSSGTCSTYINSDDTYGDDTGASASGPCKDALLEAWTNKEPIFIPVFDGHTGTGTGGTYHLEGMAAFVLTGYRFPGVTQNSWITGANPCPDPGDTCISGFFTQALVPSGAMPVAGGTSMGASVVAMTG